MSVPPPSRSSSTPPSKDDGEPKESKKSGKDFKMPKKDEKAGEEKKKNLFDIAGEGHEIKELKAQVGQHGEVGAIEEASEIDATQAKAAVDAVGKLISTMVADMKVGQVGGKDFASMTLSNTAEVPQAFAGSNLTLSYQDNALVIHFDNFMTPQQENTAITMVEKNKEQLLEMVQALQAKNITVHEMSIGKHVVALPRAEPLPPPFQPLEAGAGETRREADQQRQRREEGGAGPE